MAIPLSYNVRNLRLRKSLTIMTALGIALTVATAVFIMALLAGLGRAFATTGDPLNVLMLRKGSDSELAAGGVSRDAVQVLKDLPGVAKNARASRWSQAKIFWWLCCRARVGREKPTSPPASCLRLESRCGRRSRLSRAMVHARAAGSGGQQFDQQAIRTRQHRRLGAYRKRRLADCRDL